MSTTERPVSQDRFDGIVGDELFSIPMSEIWLPYQRRWMADTSKIKVVRKSRRTGFTMAEAFDAVNRRLSGLTSRDYFFASADESAAEEFMAYVRAFAGIYGSILEVMEIPPKDSLDVLKLKATLPAVRGRRPRIVAMTSNPTRFRSKGGDVGLDEFAHHQDQQAMWKAAFPTITWGGSIRVISSENGYESFFHDTLVKSSLRRTDPAGNGAPRSHDPNVSLHTVTIDDAIGDGLVERINLCTGSTQTRNEFREEIRSGCADEDIFQEEYLCKPSSNNESYYPWELLRAVVCVSDAKPTTSVAQFLEDVSRLGEHATEIKAGVDVGRKRDRFVIYVLGLIGGVWHTIGILSWQGQPFSAMEAAIDQIMAIKTKAGVEVSRMCIDSTGIGTQLAERAIERHYYRVEAVHWTSAVREDCGSRMRSMIETRALSLPDSSHVLGEANAVRRVITSANNTRLVFDDATQSSGHFDHLCGLWMAVHGISTGYPGLAHVELVGDTAW